MFFSVLYKSICVAKWDKMELFLGTFEHTIDSKNRLTLPSTWRKIFVDDKVIISISIDNCIEIRTTKSFNDFTNFHTTIWNQNCLPQNSTLPPTITRLGSLPTSVLPWKHHSLRSFQKMTARRSTCKNPLEVSQLLL